MHLRPEAALAAESIRWWIADPLAGGAESVVHIDFARPRRGGWFRMWANLPGLMLNITTGAYTHALLPGWEYTRSEMKTEMLDDLDLLARTGEQPKVATRK